MGGASRRCELPSRNKRTPCGDEAMEILAVAPSAGLCRGLDLARRFQPRSPEKQRAVKHLGRFAVLACVQALPMPALLCAGVVWETIADGNKYNKSVAGVLDSAGAVQPTASQADLQKASDWLNGYLSGASYRHVQRIGSSCRIPKPGNCLERSPADWGVRFPRHTTR